LAEISLKSSTITLLKRYKSKSFLVLGLGAILKLITFLDLIFNHLALISCSIKTLQPATKLQTKGLWLEDLSKLIGTLNGTLKEPLPMLSLLSSAVFNGHPCCMFKATHAL